MVYKKVRLVMKANEAPEKIYLHVVDDGEEIWHYATCKRENVDNIEYIRTDVVSEKACEYLNKNCRRFILTEKDIEDFKNYMKREYGMDENQSRLCEKCMNTPVNSKERIQILTECRSQGCWYKGY